MTVFKGFMTITKRNLNILFLYISIFLAICFAIQKMDVQNTAKSYSMESLDIAVIDQEDVYKRQAGVGREEADGIIAPVVQKFSSIHYPPVAQLVKFEDGHQLDGIDPQVLQIRDLLSDSLKGSRRADPGIHHGKSPDMHLSLIHIYPVACCCRNLHARIRRSQMESSHSVVLLT